MLRYIVTLILPCLSYRNIYIYISPPPLFHRNNTPPPLNSRKHFRRTHRRRRAHQSVQTRGGAAQGRLRPTATADHLGLG